MTKHKPVRRHKQTYYRQQDPMLRLIGDTSKMVVGLGVLGVTANAVSNMTKK